VNLELALCIEYLSLHGLLHLVSRLNTPGLRPPSITGDRSNGWADRQIISAAWCRERSTGQS